MSEQLRNKKSVSSDRDTLDFYETKVGAVKAHVGAFFQTYGYYDNIRILDFGIGSGIYGKTIKSLFPNATVHGIEISERPIEFEEYYDKIIIDDFYNYHFEKPYHLIIGNPPYYNLVDTFKRSLDYLVGYGYFSFLLKQRSLGSKVRTEFYENHRPNTIFQLNRRPIKPKEGQSGHTEDYVILNVPHYSHECKYKWLEWEDDGEFHLF